MSAPEDAAALLKDLASGVLAMMGSPCFTGPPGGSFRLGVSIGRMVALLDFGGAALPFGAMEVTYERVGFPHVVSKFMPTGSIYLVPPDILEKFQRGEDLTEDDVDRCAKLTLE